MIGRITTEPNEKANNDNTVEDDEANQKLNLVMVNLTLTDIVIIAFLFLLSATFLAEKAC